MSEQDGTNETVQTTLPRGEAVTSMAKRRRPKSIEQQLAIAMAKADALKAKALEQRDRLRAGLIDDLYARHEIGEIDGDMSERKRLALLRGKVGL